MIKRRNRLFFESLILFFFAFLLSCTNRTDVPFVPGINAYQRPVTKSFHLPQAKVINWIIQNGDTLPAPSEQNFDVATSPTKPFYADGFIPYQKPSVWVHTDWLDIPPSDFDTTLFSRKKLPCKIIKLKPPIQSKAGAPKAKTPVTKNILHFGVDEGLPAGEVQAIFQDKSGFYWIATGRGLARYDGEYFQLFSFIEKEPQGNIQVKSIAQDSKRRLWIRTSSRGIYIYDIANQVILHLKIPSYDIALDEQGWAWVLDNGLVSRINIDEGAFEQLNSAFLTDSSRISRVLALGNGNIIFRTENGIALLDKEKNTIKRWKNSNQNDSKGMSYVVLKNDGKIVYYTRSGIDVLDPNSGMVEHITQFHGIDEHIPYSPTEDLQGRIWHAIADSGIKVIDIKNSAALSLQKEDGLSENSISCIYEDHSGKMWLGSESGGINIIDNHFPVDHLSNRQGLYNNAIWSMVEGDNNDVWLASAGGLDIINNSNHSIKSLSKQLHLDKSTNSLTRIMKDSLGNIWISSMTNSGGTLKMIDKASNKISQYLDPTRAFTNIVGFMRDSEGRIWMQPYGKGVILFDPKNRTLKHINTSNGLAGNLAWKIIQASDGRIWIATSKGLSIISRNADSITNVFTDDGLSDNVTQSLVQDTSGSVWVATNEGIDKINIRRKTITSFSKRQGLEESETFALLSQKGKVFAGTSGGISIIEELDDHKNWDITNFGKKQGFYYLDVNSNTGLIFHDTLMWGIQQVVTQMAIPKRQKTIIPVAVTNVSINGEVQYFFPSLIPPAYHRLFDRNRSEQQDTFLLHEPGPKQTEKAYGMKWSSVSTQTGLPINLLLEHYQNQLTFYFTNFSVGESGPLSYSYILEGLDDRWSNETSKAQSPDYKNLTPGNYVFKVCARTANGIWSGPSCFSFTISPPWWKTWWSYLLYASIIVVLLRLYTGYRSSVLLAENNLLEKKIDQRTNELKQSLEKLKNTQNQLVHAEKMASLGELTAGIAHEIKNPLNFVNNFSELNTELIDELNLEIDAGNYNEVKTIAQNISDNQLKILHHGHKADDIVKSMLQHSKTTSNVKELTDINKLIEEHWQLAYHSSRAKHPDCSVKLSTSFDRSIEPINLNPQDLGRVLLNIINNALYAVQTIKRSTDPKFEATILIQTIKKNKEVQITIADNGGGIPDSNLNKVFQPFFTTKPTGVGTGLGLSLAYDIVKANGGELMVTNRRNDESGVNGAWFTITLPSAEL